MNEFWVTGCPSWRQPARRHSVYTWRRDIIKPTLPLSAWIAGFKYIVSFCISRMNSRDDTTSGGRKTHFTRDKCQKNALTVWSWADENQHRSATFDPYSFNCRRGILGGGGSSITTSWQEMKGQPGQNRMPRRTKEKSIKGVYILFFY